MKCKLLLLALLTFLITGPALAQTMFGEVTFQTNKHIADSDYLISAFEPTTSTSRFGGVMTGQMPDSITILWNADALTDSIKADVRVHYRLAGEAVDSLVVDSIKVAERDYKTLTFTTTGKDHTKYDEFAIVVEARATGNAVLTANNALTIKIRKYYTVPHK